MQIKKIKQHFGDKKDFVQDLFNLCKKVSDRNYQMPFGFVDSGEINDVRSICNNFVDIDFKLVCKLDGFVEKMFVVIHPLNLYYESNYTDIFKVVYSKKFKKLLHKDVLGAFLNNGIEIRSLGGIVVNDQGEINFEIESSKINLLSVISNISNISVSYDILYSSEILPEVREFVEYNISSTRLDNLVKCLCKCSRKKAQKIISLKNVKVNQSVCLKNDFIFSKGDVISIKGYNRFEICSADKKNNERFIIKVR